jgi:NADH-quinone oxidoreductase subunit N
MLVGLGFKTSLAPFHQWTPDVYQGAPTNVAAFMATVSKIGAFAAMIRILDNFYTLHTSWVPPLVVIAILTMCVGNVAALVQSDVKRILGYSSIAQAGYVLVAVISRTGTASEGNSAVYYLLSYSVMTVGAFAVVSLVAKDGKEATRLEDLRGLWKRSPLAAVALAICMLSLAGFPLTAGFSGKLMIFKDAMEAGYTPLAIVLAVNSVVSLAYYLRIAYVGFTGDEVGSERSLAKLSPGLASACVLCIAGIIGGGIFVDPIFAYFTPLR